MVYIESVLIVSSSDKGNEALSQLLKSTSYTNITVAQNGGEARRLLSQDEFDLVIINSPLSDEFGHELCIMLSD
ncbi:MAG: response regulator, partial [Clostridia bacterium]|nr:response regulator [Clostridia bacterium]